MTPKVITLVPAEDVAWKREQIQTREAVLEMLEMSRLANQAAIDRLKREIAELKL